MDSAHFLGILCAPYVSGAENLSRGTLKGVVSRGVRGFGVGDLSRVELGPSKKLIFRPGSGSAQCPNQCSDMYSERVLWVAAFEFRISFLWDIVLDTL